jgi:hypothetical protein
MVAKYLKITMAKMSFDLHISDLNMFLLWWVYRGKDLLVHMNVVRLGLKPWITCC